MANCAHHLMAWCPLVQLSSLWGWLACRQALCLAQLSSLLGWLACRQALCLAQLSSLGGWLACRQALCRAQLSSLGGCLACRQGLCRAQLSSLGGCLACRQALCLAQLSSLWGWLACRQALCLAQLSSLWGWVACRQAGRCLQQDVIFQATDHMLLTDCRHVKSGMEQLAGSSWYASKSVSHMWGSTAQSHWSSHAQQESLDPHSLRVTAAGMSNYRCDVL